MPVAPLRIQYLAGQPLALPGRVIHILNSQRRQWQGLPVRGRSLNSRLVEQPQLTGQHAH